MQRKAAAWSDLIVIPDHETTEARVRWIALAVDREVVPGLEPAAIATSQGVPGSKLQHLRVSLACRPFADRDKTTRATVLYLSATLERIIVGNRIIIYRRGAPWTRSKTGTTSTSSPESWTSAASRRPLR